MTRPIWWSSWHIKHTAETVSALRDRVLTGESQASIANELGLDRKGIYRLLFVREGGQAFRLIYLANRRARELAGLSQWRKAKKFTNRPHDEGGRESLLLPGRAAPAHSNPQCGIADAARTTDFAIACVRAVIDGANS